ncbi:MAG: FAD:protein FMN transferase [Sphingobacteriaceae bacterium]|nr:MAG: FAD:protein FMN transferase [Sphingobacteriaceae bacterium]
MLAIKSLTDKLPVYRQSAMLMGTRFEISVIGENPVWAQQRIDVAIREINRVEKLLSAFGEGSSVNQINRNAGVEPVKVSGELFRLIERSVQISQLTYGSFDITYAAADKKAVSYKDIVLDAQKQTVFLQQDGMRISFAGLSKGYAADRAKYMLQMEEVSSGVINAGGDLLAWGLQTDNQPWTVATADPEQENQQYANLNISNMAFATSVNTGHYIANGKKTPGAINTANGFEVSAIHTSSILSPTAEMANAMAAPVINIGVNNALYLINRLNQIGCVIIDDNGRSFTSKGINLAS